VNLKAGPTGRDDGPDGFFALNTMGGSESSNPESITGPVRADDTVNASASTLPLIIFGSIGNDAIYGGQGGDIILGHFGRVQFIDPATGQMIASLGAGGHGDFTTSQIVQPTWIYSRDLTLGGNDFIQGGNGENILIGGTGNDSIGGGGSDDLIIGGAARLQNRISGTIANPVYNITNPRFQVLNGTQIYDPLTGQVMVSGVAQNYRDPNGHVPLWASWQIQNLYQSSGSFGSNYIAGGGGNNEIFGGPGNDVIQGAGSIEYKSHLQQSLAITSATWSSNTATITTSAANGFQSGQSVTISGLTPVAYNGTFAITVINSTTFKYTLTLTTNPGTGTGTAAIVTGLAMALPGRQVGVANADPSNVAGNPFRDKNNALELYPSFTAPTDGDNYIEGGGGNNIIFGGGGQNDIVGGNSDLFSLTTQTLRAQQPNGSNLIFGGAGTDVYRNDPANATDPNRHAQNSDVILSNDGDIFRLVGVTDSKGNVLLAPLTGTGSVNGVATSNGFLAFNYDINRPDIPGPHELIIPRGAKLLDYTPGGPAYPPTSAQAKLDIGGFSEIHAENGDAFIFGEAAHKFTATGQSGNVIFGGSGDDQIVGGYGNNWITGGTGNTTIIGQDGRIYASRNGLAEPLNGVTAIPANQLNQVISTPGKVQQATINVAGQLKTTVDLEPFSEDTTFNGTAPEWQGGFTAPNQSDDIIFAGTGNATVHGGSGDDAISGGQALPVSYLQTEDHYSGNLTGIAESDWYHPYNPGDALRFNPIDPSGTHSPKEVGRTGQFALYNEFDPRRKILLNADGTASTTGTGLPWLLDLNAGEKDGNDVLFGDLGNNWIVAGTGQNDLFGGFGNDLLDARSSQDIDGGLNDMPNTVNITNRAYGGAGKDVLIADTAADRLIDWVGNFDTYIVPFAPWGMPTVSRTVQPQLQQFLYALSQSDGADQTLAADYGTDPTRNGEPAGELGLVVQHDAAWHQQTGAPSDQPPGNIGGVQRVILKSASLTGQVTSFFPDSGTWSSSSSGYTGSAAAGSDAVSLLYLDQWQPNYLEFYGTVRLGGANNRKNGFLIFDYQSPTNFRYAGIDGTSNLLRIGQRTASGWIDDATLSYGLSGNNAKTFEVILNGTTAQLVMNGTTLQYTFPDALNVGMLGLGLNGTSDSFTSYTVQTLPRVFTYQESPAVTSTGLTGFTVQSGQGSANSNSTRYLLTPPTGGAALSTRSLNVASSSYVELQATVNAAANGTWAGLVFAYTSPNNFLFAAVVPGTNQVLLGHRNPAGWFVDAVATQTITAGTDYSLLVSLDNSPYGGIPPTATVVLNGKSVLSYTYNIQLAGGPTQGNLQLGLLAQNGVASFSNVSIRGDDPAYGGGGTPQTAAAPAPASSGQGSPLTSAQLVPVVAAAIERWTAMPGMAGEAAALGQVPVTIAPLPGLMLGETIAGTITINPTAAGYGWFVDATPLDDTEFTVQGGQLVADRSSPAFGRMDLETVVLHELGHVLGLPDLNLPAQTNNLMAADFMPGVRRLPDGLAAVVVSHDKPTNTAQQTATVLQAMRPAPSTAQPSLAWSPMTAALGLESAPSVPSPAVANVFSNLSATVGLLSVAMINETLRSADALLLELSTWMSSTIAEWWPGSGSPSDPRAMSLALPAAAGSSGAWSSNVLARAPSVDAIFGSFGKEIPPSYLAVMGDPASDSLLSSVLIDDLLSEVTWLQHLRYRL
jgi:hypothetical protein